jgi:cbb3-type cytochrome oxidase subunit 3
MNLEALSTILLQASEDAGGAHLSDQTIGIIVGIMLLIGVVWMIKRIRSHKSIDQKMSIRLDDDPSQQSQNLLARR